MARWCHDECARLDLDRAVQVEPGPGTLLCSRARHFTLLQILSSPRCINGYRRMLGVTLQWICMRGVEILLVASCCIETVYKRGLLRYLFCDTESFTFVFSISDFL